MPRLDDVRVPGAELHLGAVLVLHREPPGSDDPGVTELTAIGAGDGLDALGPLPARLEGHAGAARVPDPHDVDASLVRGSRLVRGVEVQRVDASHGSLS